MTTKTTTKSLTPEEEITELKARLAELEGKQIVEEPVRQDDYIPVMSLIPYNLNLSTKEGGQGNIKKFTHFGEVKRILARDLIDILDVHRNFVEGGLFYILHPAFVRQNGLDDVYSKILTKEKIEEILSTKSDKCVDLYNSATDSQKEVIVDLLVEKARTDPKSINLNVVDRISRVSKKDIMQLAEEARKSSQESEEAE